jgi:hypothetical protein
MGVARRQGWDRLSKVGEGGVRWARWGKVGVGGGKVGVGGLKFTIIVSV